MDPLYVLKASVLVNLVNSKQYPRFLYKYRAFDEHSLDALSNHSLWFSFPDSFNDPFEGRIRISAEMANSILEPVGMNSQEGIEQFLSECDEKLINPLRKKNAVCCLSGVPDQILLWSHYAESHKGFCLEFDLLSDPDFFWPLLPVQYEKEFLESDVFNNTNEAIRHLFQRKYVDWDYEKEFRLFRTKEGLFPFKPGALKRVIFGCRSGEEYKQKIKDILGDSVQYSVCSLDARAFKLNIQPLTR